MSASIRFMLACISLMSKCGCGGQADNPPVHIACEPAKPGLAGHPDIPPIHIEGVVHETKPAHTVLAFGQKCTRAVMSNPR
eukprot:CAMPEP_0117495410 /NCGR_PEP_ID=MMETSP0784-20121206/20116_1 /TAXON_ID=39447 /ORGANISM="" /LENGTH=80 /DNA_ID=CAMNT_0005290327 /DNA_START=138 /DNA_END=380 /DNA_ORIENTATION=-